MESTPPALPDSEKSGLFKVKKVVTPEIRFLQIW